MAVISIKKIVLDVRDEEAFLISNFKYKCNDFYIKLITRNEAYHGKFSIDDLNNKATSIRMSLEDFLSNTLNALTINSDHIQFIYELNNCTECDKLFTWTKCIASEGINLILATVPLTSVDREAMLFEILSLVSEQMNSLNTKIDNLNTVQEQFKSEKQKILKCLEDSVQAKEELEREMYSKFCLVLNEKKDMIRNLKARISELESKNDICDPQPSTSGRNLNTSNAAERTSDSAYSDEDNKHKKKKKPSSKCSLGTDFSPLILDDEIGMNLPSRPRRRIRQESDNRSVKTRQNTNGNFTEASKFSAKVNAKRLNRKDSSNEEPEELIDLM